MGIQINGQNDTISAGDGGLVISGQELNNVTDINASGIGTFGSGVVLTGGDITLGTGVTASGSTVNEFAVSTNGSERVRVDSSGNINIDSGGVFYDATNNRLGIGTAVPGTSLHIQGANTTGKGQLIVSSASAGQEARMTFVDGSDDIAEISTNGNDFYFLNETATGTFQWYTGGSESFRCDSSGRLLVGTSSALSSAPGSLAGLTVQGYPGFPTGQAYLALARGQNASSVSADNSLGFVVFTDNGGNAFAQIRAAVDSGTPGSGSYPGRLEFSTTADGDPSPTERMRIDSAGSVLINTDTTNISSNEKLTVNGTSTFYRSSATAGYFKRTSNDGNVIAFFRDTTGVGSISVTTTTTAYNTSSDYRLKENVTPVTDGIIRLQQLKPSRFNFIADPLKTVDGFIAHEVQTVVPEAITGQKDAVDEDGNPVYQGIDQSKLVPLLTAALQEAIGRIETLESENATLKSDFTALAARVTALESA